MGKGFEYETVDDRLHKFWNLFPEGRIETRLEFHDDIRVIFEARIWKINGPQAPDANGWAEEHRNAKKINEVWSVENCETSAIGRALANLGLSGSGKRPSQLEMTKQDRHPGKPEQPGDVSTEVLKQEMNDLSEVDRGKLRGLLEKAGLPLPVPEKLTPEIFQQYDDILKEVLYL